jgi:hypothetical protein
MTTRMPCGWSNQPENECAGDICTVCKGYIVQNYVNECPFVSSFETKSQFEHLISADERYFIIQHRSKLEDVKS